MLLGRMRIFSVPLLGLMGSTAALAEPVSEIAPIVSDDVQDYEPDGIDLGGFRISSEFKTIATIDSNVYAAPTGEQSDLVFNVLGGLEAKGYVGGVDVRINAKGGFRRLTKLTTENSETGSVLVALNWKPRATHTLSVAGGWLRAVEERGDPEALQLTSTGPRLTNIFEAQTRYSQETGPFIYSAEVGIRKYDVLGARNDQRDFTTTFASATVGTSIGTWIYGTATAYVNRRDFRLPILSTGASQNETTIGGRLGITTKERGIIEGRASIGMFRLNPADPLQKTRSGLSADIALTARPQPRTAITLNVSSGDVATFRLGAVARADTSVVLIAQQEIRHNFYGSLGLVLRRSVFLGSGDKENTLGPRFELEWLANKLASVGGYISFNHRTSNIVEENFDRLRGGISLRLRY